jgi:large subunit ribosomal protein L9
MKVILLENVKNVGKKDEVKEVSDGYARNFLIPNKKALAYTPVNKKHLEAQQAAKAADDAAAKAQAEKTAEALKDITLEFTLHAGKNGAVFGSISSKQIAAALAQKGIQVDKRKIDMDQGVSSLGTTRLKADLYKGQVFGEIIVHVSGKEG